MYRVIIEQKALKEIDTLPNDILQPVFDTINDLKSIPRPHGVKKLMMIKQN